MFCFVGCLTSQQHASVSQGRGNRKENIVLLISFEVPVCTVFVHVYANVCVFVYLCECVCVYVRVHSCACMCSYVPSWIFVYMCPRARISLRVHACVCVTMCVCDRVCVTHQLGSHMSVCRVCCCASIARVCMYVLHMHVTNSHIHDTVCDLSCVSCDDTCMCAQTRH